MNWLKRLFGGSDDRVKMEAPKGKISEPVNMIAKAFLERPKTFKWELVAGAASGVGWTRLKLTDTVMGESWCLELYLKPRYRVHAHNWDVQGYPPLNLADLPLLQWHLTTVPSWLTQDEREFLSQFIRNVYLRRIGRLTGIKAIRQERVARKAKQEQVKKDLTERQRLIDLYKKA